VQEAIKRFGADGGSIINLSSIVGSHPVAGVLLYASTKGAIETLTRGLALELAPRKIRVNAIAPGHTETEGNVAAGPLRVVPAPFWLGRRPLGRLGRVTDIAPLAVFLASDESAWITGEVIRAAGGLVVAPEYLSAMWRILCNFKMTIFAAYRSLKLTRDADGVLVVEFHSKGGPFRFTGARSYGVCRCLLPDRPRSKEQDCDSDGAGGEFIPEIDFLILPATSPILPFGARFTTKASRSSKI